MKKIFFTLTIASLFIAQFSFSQTTYQKTIGGTGSEENNYCIHTPDGGFLIAGSTTSGGAGGKDIYVMRTDAGMNILWTKTFGGPGDDILFDRQPTLSLGQIATPIGTVQGPSGGFVILGHTFSFGQGSSDLYLLRIDNSGNLLWSKTYGTNQIERGISVRQLSNGDLLLLGDVEPGPFGGKDVYIIRTDANGNTLWNKRFGSGGHDQIYSSQISSDGGFIFAGSTSSSGAGNVDAHLLKSDAGGNIQWSKTYGGFNNDIYQSIVELSGGGYAVTGSTQSFGAGAYDFFLSKTDASGNILWTKTYGGGNSDISDHLIQTNDGGYAFMGATTSFGAGNLDVMLAKTDSSGNLQWSEVYGGAGVEIARSLDEMNSGGYHICGFTNSFGAGEFDIYTIRTDANGNSGCHETSVNPTVTSSSLTTQNFNPNVTTGGIEGTPVTQTGTISFQQQTLCAPGSSCATAIDLGQGDTCVNNITMSGSEMWFRFVADSDYIVFSAFSTVGDTINTITLYSGTCGGLVPIDSSRGGDNDSLYYSGFYVLNGTYYLRITGEINNNINTCIFHSAVIFNAKACLDNSQGPGAWAQKANSGEKNKGTGFGVGNFGYVGTGSFPAGMDDFHKWDPITNSWCHAPSTIPPLLNNCTPSLAQFPGPGRDVCKSFTIQDNGYFTIGANILEDLYEYNSSTNVWTQRNPMPSGNADRIDGVAFSIGTNGFVGLGVTTTSSSVFFSDFWKWDGNPLSQTFNQWTPIAPFPGGPRIEAIALTVCDKAYVGGGRNGGVTNDWWEYDPATNTWTQKSPIPVSPLDADAVGGFSLCCKGYLVTNSTNLLEYDALTDTWTQLTSLPTTSSYNQWAFGFHLKGKGYMAGINSNSIFQAFWEWTPNPVISYAPPISNFTANPNLICAGGCVTFNTNPTSTCEIYNWTFPVPPFTSMNPNPTVCFPSPGTYNVTLTVTNCGGWATSSQQIIVTPAPTVNINASQTVICQSGGCATLTAQVTGGAAPFTYLWSQQSPPQIFCSGPSPTCSVCPTSTTTYDLIVTDANGCTATDQVTVVVSSAVANAGPDQTICAGDCTILNGSGGVTYTWSPATGLSNPNVSNPTACPAVITNYTLTVTNIFGCAATDFVTVFVNPLPTASFTLTANENCMNQTFSFFGSANVPITSWLWDFGDGGISTLQNLIHIYTTPGQFAVILTVTDANGCCDVFSQLVSVTPSTSAYNTNCCSQGVTYITNPSPPIGMTINSFEITGTVTNPFPFNQALPIRDTVIIRAGSVCTLQNITTMFGPWGRIIVEPGATLILNSTTLTGLETPPTACSDILWQGIEVWGDAAKAHTISQQPFQGKLIMNNASIIKKAHNAVTLGKFADRFLPTQCNQSPPKPCRDGDYITCMSGGILNASGKCEFRNNAHNIRVSPYPFPEASFVNGCVFVGGPVFDPGYRIGSSYQYPNPANFYYATANPSGRTSRFGHIWKARWLITSYLPNPQTFINNSFNTAEIGIEIINGKSIITGNGFTNMNRGISGMYYTPSPFIANKIKGNTFSNTIVQSTNAATPAPVASIYLSASIGDRISNANNFGDPLSSLTDALAQTKNPIGIYMSNSSYFKILDNNFNRTGKGIFVINSSANGGVIQRFTSGNGNFFPRNNNAIFTFFNNSSLKIRCNTTNNNLPSAYGVNWDNNIQIIIPFVGPIIISFPLANQGLPAPNPSAPNAKKLPAGNRFDLTNTSLKEIRSKYPYTYYSHQSNPEFVPFNSTINSSVSIQPQTGVTCNTQIWTTQCCPTEACLSETPPPACPPSPQRIGNIDNEITALQTEFDSVFANLDKGQTAQLLAAISGNTSDGDLKNMLLNNSFLSDEVLLAFISRQSTAPGIFKNVMLPNSPVSENVMPALETKMNSLPPGIAMQIKDAQSSNAYRTLTNVSREISALQVERQSVVNSVLSVLVDNDSAQAINLLEQENTVAADQILLGTYLAFSNLSAAQAKLAGMTASNAEEQAFLDLQGTILNLELQGNSVFEMDSAQEALVRSIASMPTSLAQANACALLYLVFNEHCPDPLTTVSLREQSPDNAIASGAKQSAVYLGDNIPNPFNNTTTIPYTLPDEIEKAFINIYDIAGKLLSSHQVNNKNINLVISCSDMENGVYIYKLEATGIILGNKKMLIIK